MDNTLSPSRSQTWGIIPYLLPIVTAIALIVALYDRTFYYWVFEWTFPGSYYAHALFVPFFVLAMIWRDKERLAMAPYNPSWLGVAFLIPSMLLLLVGLWAGVMTVTSISFMLLILAVSIMIVGKTRTRLLLFPLLFIMLMMPLVPDQLINVIAFPIQLMSAKIATLLLNLMTLTSVQTGTLIQMENYSVAVELPCSGFKTLVSLLTFSAAFAYLTEAAKWKRWTLFLTTIPLSLIINSLRITMIGMVGELISSKAASTFHDYSGFIVLILAFTFLFNFARLLRCDRFLGMSLNDRLTDKDAVGKPADEGGETIETVERPHHEPWWAPLRSWRPTRQRLQRALPLALGLNVVVLLAVAVKVTALRPIVPQAPISRAQVPMVFEAPGATPGHTVTYTAIADERNDKLTKEILESLNPTRVINRVYNGSDGSSIELFITAGNGRKVFHDPNTCMLGTGSTLRDVRMIPIPSSAGPVTVLETRFTRQGIPDETEMLICYVVDGQMVPHTEDVRNRIMKQTLFGDGGRPSYCFRVTQRSPGTDEQKQTQIKSFVSGLWGHIGPVLMGKIRGDKSDGPPEVITEVETAGR